MSVVRLCVRPVLVLTLALPPAFPASGQAADPGDAVFQVVVVDMTTTRYVQYGTGFFIRSDGTALTNSHVVYLAQHRPDRYRLMAVVGKRGSAEFYDAMVICASKLPYDPTRPDPNKVGVPSRKDVAVVKLAPATASFSTLAHRLPDGQQLPLANAHRDAVPPFPTLRIGGRPGAGQTIRVIGYGHISPIPEKWIATGQIAKVEQANDGTGIFLIEFTSRPQPGNSGSPVLNGQDQVIGIWTWYSFSQSNLGTAQSNTALERPCS